MVDANNIRAMKREIRNAERRAARERQAKFTAKKKADGMRRLSLWATPEDAALVRTILALPAQVKRNLEHQLIRYLQQKQSDNKNTGNG